MKPLDFTVVKKLFPQEQWDVGYITKAQLQICAYTPIKWKFHVVGLDFSNDIHFDQLQNCIVLIKETPKAGDYDFYKEAATIMAKSGVIGWDMVYTNFKEAAIQAGLGVKAKNSLIYSYRFGFDCKICVIRFDQSFKNIPINKRVNKKLWNRCVDCWDCAINCPVKAIHNEGNDMKDHWLDSSKCDNFIGLSDHPTIPSIKKFWHKHVHPEVPKEEVDKLKTWFDVKKKYGTAGLPWDKNGYSFNSSFGAAKDGKPIDVPMCRECTSQPRCSKWKGNYPYDKQEWFMREQ